VEHHNFDLMYYIYFSQFVFDEFIAKGGKCAQSVITLLLNRWLREVCGNMINSTQGGELALRKLGGVLSFSLLFHLSFATFLPILEFCGFLFLDDHF
jgi:hypothetical protein